MQRAVTHRLLPDTARKVHARPPPTLIPVLVTGIQPTRVCVAKRLLSVQGLGLAGSL
ncbi:CycL protein (modular protein) [Agrobacterium tumefaciens str. Kerr 14]|uniref:CycL protein (Modular protein) n=1 Tax=Agrobacterium tumefaciens str. Kerr 14 TaxID=1183424 RepID=A0A1S7R680_AGRTU|nr:CycL protein (modular protein) [Agrobacterium tumefaciens str. Kerr 14]